MPEPDPARPGDRVEVWDALTLEVPETIADELAGALALDGLGAECIATGDGRTRIRVVLRSESAAGDTHDRARRMLTTLGLSPDDCKLSIERIRDERWVERYIAALKPIPLGSTFLVDPCATPEEVEGRTRIALCPGRAFGTGEHATTQLCAEQLERAVSPGSRWLDLGCGTAILSIVARARGAGDVLALDTDPDAVAVARQVLRVNRVDRGVEVRCKSLTDVPDRDFDGIVANIHAPYFLDNASLLAERLRPGGVLVASGFLDDDLRELVPPLLRAGFTESSVTKREPWVAWFGRCGKGPA